jgi:DNA-binding GntR family transcriptional regulator
MNPPSLANIDVSLHDSIVQHNYAGGSGSASGQRVTSQLVATKPSAPTTLRRVSTQEALIEALRAEVLEGRVAPGTILREPELCTRFGVSRHTVRTALQALTHEGLALHSPNRGVLVPQLENADVRDLYAVRTMLEVPAARHLASDPDARAQPRQALERLNALPADMHWSAVRDADLDFHRAIVDALNSPRASRTFAALSSELRLAFRQLEDELRLPKSVAADHAELLATMEAGDPDAAEAAIREHLSAAASVFADD